MKYLARKRCTCLSQIAVLDKSHSGWSGASRPYLGQFTVGVSPIPMKGGGRRGGLGEDISEPARLGPAGLETLDTLIMAGIADTRGEAIRRVLERIRERPAYEQLFAELLNRADTTRAS